MSKKTKDVKPTAGAKWLAELLESEELSPARLEVAKLAAEQLDIAEISKAAVEKYGAMVKTPYGMKCNPCVAQARKAGESFSRLVKSLRTLGAPIRRPGRPSANDETWQQPQSKPAQPVKDALSEFVPKSRTN